MKLISHITILPVVVLLAGCADQYRQPTAYSPSGQVISSPKYATGQPGYNASVSEGDRALESQLQQSLHNSSLSQIASGVSVSARNGTVTLSGSVPTESDRQAVDTLVRNTTGVTSVMDQLQISSTAGSSGQTAYTYGTQQQPGAYNYQQQSTQPQSTTDTDRELVDKVQNALRSNTSSSWLAQSVNVSAQNGAVTLTGTIPNDQQRQVVDNVVRNVNGVSSVYDQLQITATPTGRSDQQQNYSYNNTSQQQQQQYPAQPPQQEPQQQQQQQSYSGNANASPTLATGDIFNLHVQGLNDTDRNLAQNILQGLRTDSLLHALLPTVNINVSGGRVILQGTVQNEQQRQAIATVVQRAAGGSNVDNQLQVNSR